MAKYPLPDPCRDCDQFPGSSWSKRLSAHVADLQGQITKLKYEVADQDPRALVIAERAEIHLQAARAALRGNGRWPARPFRRFAGGHTDSALANTHEAEVAILRIVPQVDLRWRGLAVLVQARLHLDPQDIRLQQLETVFAHQNARIEAPDRELLVSTLHAAYQAEEAERAKVRSFMHIVCAATVMMALIAVGFAIWAFLQSKAIGTNFCFLENPDDLSADPTICPFGKGEANWEGVWLIEFMGMLGAALAGAVALRKVRGTAGPYYVATSLLLLRLPVGALTAVIGIMFLSGRFFPGLTALDTPIQILMWAAAFGVLQETVMQAVDRQGRALLDNVRSPGRAPGEGSGPPPRKPPPPPPRPAPIVSRVARAVAARAKKKS